MDAESGPREVGFDAAISPVHYQSPSTLDGTGGGAAADSASQDAPHVTPKSGPRVTGSAIANSARMNMAMAMVATDAADVDREDEHESLFDVFHLHLSQLEVYMAHSSESWRLFSSEQVAQRSLVDRVDLSAEIQVCVLLYDSTLPLVKIFVDLPELHLRLTESKLIRLAAFGQAILNRSKVLRPSLFVTILPYITSTSLLLSNTAPHTQPFLQFYPNVWPVLTRNDVLIPHTHMHTMYRLFWRPTDTKQNKRSEQRAEPCASSPHRPRLKPPHAQPWQPQPPQPLWQHLRLWGCVAMPPS